MSVSTTTPPPSRSRVSGAGGENWVDLAIQVLGGYSSPPIAAAAMKPGSPVEVRATDARRRDQVGHNRRPPPARDQQTEPDRASAVCLHHAELARQAAPHPSGDRQYEYEDQDRTDRGMPSRPQQIREGHQGLRRGDG